MRLGEGVEWGLHCATLLSFVPEGQALPAARLAEYHGVPAAYLAKHLQSLSRAGIVETVAGPKGGYRLARLPTDITVLDVVEALDGGEPAFRCTEIRRRGPAALPAREYRLPCAIHVVMDRADAAWREQLAAVSIADLVATLGRDAPRRALAKGAQWFQEVLR
ncbi:MAG TPA: Rrf2 family transcriptional regulator [Acidimicrobiia bacterium]